MDPETRRRIGPLPEGHGLLGLIIREDRAYRIPDINLDPRRSGFPPNHPPMQKLPGRADHGQGPDGRPALPHEQGRLAGVQRGGPGDRRDIRPARRDRDGECPAARAASAAGRARRARADLAGPPRRDHPESLRGRAFARGRARSDGRRSGRVLGPGRAGDRRDLPRDPGHPELHLQPPAGAPRGRLPGRRPGCPDRGVPPQHADRARLAPARPGPRAIASRYRSPARDRRRVAQQHRPPRAGDPGNDRAATRRGWAGIHDPDRRQRPGVRSGRGGSPRSPGSREHP